MTVVEPESATVIEVKAPVISMLEVTNSPLIDRRSDRQLVSVSVGIVAKYCAIVRVLSMPVSAVIAPDTACFESWKAVPSQIVFLAIETDGVAFSAVLPSVPSPKTVS